MYAESEGIRDVPVPSAPFCSVPSALRGADFLPRKNRTCAVSPAKAKLLDNQIKVDAFHMMRTF